VKNEIFFTSQFKEDNRIILLEEGEISGEIKKANVMSIPTYALYKHQKESNISITRRGNLKVKKTIYAPFWQSTNFLMQKNTRDFDAY